MKIILFCADMHACTKMSCHLFLTLRVCPELWRPRLSAQGAFAFCPRSDFPYSTNLQNSSQEERIINNHGGRNKETSSKFLATQKHRHCRVIIVTHTVFTVTSIIFSPYTVYITRTEFDECYCFSISLSVNTL